MIGFTCLTEFQANFLYSYAISIKTKTHMDIKCLDKKMKKKYFIILSLSVEALQSDVILKERCKEKGKMNPLTNKNNI